MAKTLHVAAVQMDVAPAPTAERLARAQALVAQAANEGARVVVLPELFNTGYIYDDANYRRAESLHGPTVAWMMETAQRTTSTWPAHCSSWTKRGTKSTTPSC